MGDVEVERWKAIVRDSLRYQRLKSLAKIYTHDQKCWEIRGYFFGDSLNDALDRQIEKSME